MDNELVTKIKLLDMALEEVNLSGIFEKTQHDDSCGYRAFQNMKNGSAVLFIFLDDSIYTSGSIAFANLDDLGKKEKIIRLFNDLNGKYKSYRFRINDSNDLMAEFSYIAPAESFNAKLFLDILVDLYHTIQDEEYAKVMRVLWA